LGFRNHGFIIGVLVGCRVWHSRFRVNDSMITVTVFGFRVFGLEFRD
jgi:hypothetical protein